MIQTLTKNWLLLAVGGVLQAMIAVIYLVMQGTGGPLTFYSWHGTIVLAGKLAMAAAVCSIVAGLIRSTTGKSWPLVLNGLALGALGVIQYGFIHRPISFLTVALLIVLMSASSGILELVIARTLRRNVADRWLLRIAGAASAGFALVFLALGFRWISIEPGSHSDLLWLGAFFGFSALCILGLALRLHSQDFSQSGQREELPQLGSPRIAH